MEGVEVAIPLLKVIWQEKFCHTTVFRVHSVRIISYLHYTYCEQRKALFLPLLLGLHTYSVRAFCFVRRFCLLFVVCLSRVRSRKLSKIGKKFRNLYRKRWCKKFEPRVCV